MKLTFDTNTNEETKGSINEFNQRINEAFELCLSESKDITFETRIKTLSSALRNFLSFSSEKSVSEGLIVWRQQEKHKNEMIGVLMETKKVAKAINKNFEETLKLEEMTNINRIIGICDHTILKIRADIDSKPPEYKLELPQPKPADARPLSTSTEGGENCCVRICRCLGLL
jgi:hypothetical protein